ncbi:amidohydrolase [bacterium CPR1]|nr:amidohydrolase [bacterium CPR1]
MDLSGYPLLDSHCHPIWREQPPDYGECFTEAHHSAGHARNSLFFLRSQRDLAALLGCASDEVEQARCLRSSEELFQRCLSGVDELLLDDGLSPDRCLPLEWHARFVPVRRLVRLEQVAEQLYDRGPFAGFLERYVASLESTPAAGFKSIAAYRTGLAIGEGEQAEAAYRSWNGGRLALKPLNDHLVRLGLEVAARRNLPVQFHTGFGDPDLDLETSNPLALRPLIERFSSTKLVLLHASYPFAREAGFLASVYPNVYLDFGLAVPFLSVRGMVEAVAMLLELGPLSKLTWSSDASRISELFYLGALWGRRVLGQVLEQAMRDGDLSAGQAEQAARDILRGNAAKLYSSTAS